jgi:hypothetical protein
MPDEPRFVTRREFYTAVGMAFNLIGLLALGLVRMREDTLYSIGMLLVAFGAILTGLAYAVMGLRAKSKLTVPDAPSPPSPRGPD